MNKRYLYISSISSLAILLFYSGYLIFKSNKTISSVNDFFQKNPQCSIKYTPSRYFNKDFILNDSLQSTRLSIIIDANGCPTCIEKEARLLKKYWDSIGHSTLVYTIGNIPSLDTTTIDIDYRRVRRDIIFPDSNISINPLFIIHDDDEIKSIRLSNPNRYGYFNREGEYHELVSNILSG